MLSRTAEHPTGWASRRVAPTVCGKHTPHGEPPTTHDLWFLACLPYRSLSSIRHPVLDLPLNLPTASLNLPLEIEFSLVEQTTPNTALSVSALYGVERVER